MVVATDCTFLPTVELSRIGLCNALPHRPTISLLPRQSDLALVRHYKGVLFSLILMLSFDLFRGGVARRFSLFLSLFEREKEATTVLKKSASGNGENG